MKIQVKVIPRSSSNKIVKVDDKYYKVKVIQAPEKGKANKMVVEILAEYFKIKKSQVKIIKGLTIQDKIVEINA